MVNKRGSVTRAFSKIKRYAEDEEYRRKIIERGNKYSKEHRKEKNIYERERIKKLNEFANLRCKKCNKLLYHKNKSGLCNKHIWMWKKLKKNEIH